MVWRVQVSVLSLFLMTLPAAAQRWSPFDGEPFWERSGRDGSYSRPRIDRDSQSVEQDPYWFDRDREPPSQPLTFEGGGRPYIEPEVPPVVDFPYAFPARSIVIDNAGKKLYFVLGDGQAYAYPISIGREGFSWTGTEKISRKQEWPDWHPPAEMRKRDPKLPEKMTGGVRNPLGAMALYLGNTLYRIHGTNDPKTIGRASSSGCFRMMNAHVLHLATLAEVGTSVSVIMRLPEARLPEVAEARPARPRFEAPRVQSEWSQASRRVHRPEVFDDEDTYEYIDGAYRRVDPYVADPYFVDEPVARPFFRRAPRYWRDPYER